MSRTFTLAFILCLLLFFACNKVSVSIQMNDPRIFRYLALGDSYTIGEAVPMVENFPNQAVNILQQNGYSFTEPRIIAKTGWTTYELEEGILQADSQGSISDPFDLVTLLIGVNNQYRGRPLSEYKIQFRQLLLKAISFAGNQSNHVIVLSIPDWGVTPFASGRDRDQIAREIDEFNKANREISMEYNVHYIDITPWTREAIHDQSLLATDGLHPSGKEYKRWSQRIAAFVSSQF